MGTNAQQFCLKWNNHQANMLSVFDRLLTNKSLVDVTIGCEGRSVKAHKVVLSACSPFFENLFTENPCKHPIVILKDIRYADLKALVEFMYKGEVNVVQEQLPTLLKTAEALKIKGLAEVTGGDKSSHDDKPHASVTPRAESPGRRKRQRVRRKSTDSAAAAAHSDSEESVPKASRTEHDDSSMDGATSLDDGSQASLQPAKEPSNVQSNAIVNNSSSSNQANATTTNGPNSKDNNAQDFEPTRLLEASMTTDHAANDNSTDHNSTGPDNNLMPDGLDIKPIITLEEGATPAGAIVPASAAPSLPTGTDAISSLFPQATGASALPGTSYQASPQSHDGYQLQTSRQSYQKAPDEQVHPRPSHDQKAEPPVLPQITQDAEQDDMMIDSEQDEAVKNNDDSADASGHLGVIGLQPHVPVGPRPVYRGDDSRTSSYDEFAKWFVLRRDDKLNQYQCIFPSETASNAKICAMTFRYPSQYSTHFKVRHTEEGRAKLRQQGELSRERKKRETAEGGGGEGPSQAK